MSELNNLKKAISEYAGYVRESMLISYGDAYKEHSISMKSLDYLLELASSVSADVDWEERAVLEARRNLENAERALAAEYALRYVIEKLQHHHTSRPGITEIIKSTKRLYKDAGGLTLFAPDKSGLVLAQAEPAKSVSSPAESQPS